MRESHRLSAMCVQGRIRNSSYCSCPFDCAVCFALTIHRTIALIRLSQKQPGKGGGGIWGLAQWGLALWHDKR